MSDPILNIPAGIADAITGALNALTDGDADKDSAANQIAQAILDARPVNSVEMRPAYNWTCPECGVDNFVRAIAMSMTDEDRERMEIPEDETGNFVSYPNTVACDNCGAEFRCVGFNSDEEDEP